MDTQVRLWSWPLRKHHGLMKWLMKVSNILFSLVVAQVQVVLLPIYIIISLYGTAIHCLFSAYVEMLTS